MNEERSYAAIRRVLLKGSQDAPSGVSTPAYLENVENHNYSYAETRLRLLVSQVQQCLEKNKDSSHFTKNEYHKDPCSTSSRTSDTAVQTNKSDCLDADPLRKNHGGDTAAPQRSRNSNSNSLYPSNDSVPGDIHETSDMEMEDDYTNTSDITATMHTMNGDHDWDQLTEDTAGMMTNTDLPRNSSPTVIPLKNFRNLRSTESCNECGSPVGNAMLKLMRSGGLEMLGETPRDLSYWHFRSFLNPSGYTPSKSVPLKRRGQLAGLGSYEDVNRSSQDTDGTDGSEREGYDDTTSGTMHDAMTSSINLWHAPLTLAQVVARGTGTTSLENSLEHAGAPDAGKKLMDERDIALNHAPALTHTESSYCFSPAVALVDLSTIDAAPRRSGIPAPSPLSPTLPGKHTPHARHGSHGRLGDDPHALSGSRSFNHTPAEPVGGTCTRSSPDGSCVVVGTRTGWVWFFPTRTAFDRNRGMQRDEEKETAESVPFVSFADNEILHPTRVTGHDGAVTAISFTESGAFCLSAGEDCACILWSVRRRSKLRRFSTSSMPSDACFLRTNNNFVLVSTLQLASLTVFNLSTGLGVIKSTCKAPVNCIALDRYTGPFFFTGGVDGTLSMWFYDYVTQSASDIVPTGKTTVGSKGGDESKSAVQTSQSTMPPTSIGGSGSGGSSGSPSSTARPATYTTPFHVIASLAVGKGVAITSIAAAPLNRDQLTHIRPGTDECGTSSTASGSAIGRSVKTMTCSTVLLLTLACDSVRLVVIDRDTPCATQPPSQSSRTKHSLHMKGLKGSVRKTAVEVSPPSDGQQHLVNNRSDEAMPALQAPAGKGGSSKSSAIVRRQYRLVELVRVDGICRIRELNIRAAFCPPPPPTTMGNENTAITFSVPCEEGLVQVFSTVSRFEGVGRALPAGKMMTKSNASTPNRASPAIKVIASLGVPCGGAPVATAWSRDGSHLWAVTRDGFVYQWLRVPALMLREGGFGEDRVAWQQHLERAAEVQLKDRFQKHEERRTRRRERRGAQLSAMPGSEGGVSFDEEEEVRSDGWDTFDGWMTGSSDSRNSFD